MFVTLLLVQAKLDEYALEIKGKVCESTQRTVYEQVNKQSKTKKGTDVLL